MYIYFFFNYICLNQWSFRIKYGFFTKIGENIIIDSGIGIKSLKKINNISLDKKKLNYIKITQKMNKIKKRKTM